MPGVCFRCEPGAASGRRAPRAGRAAAFALLLLGGSGCGGVPVAAEPAAVLPAWQRLLAAEGQVRALPTLALGPPADGAPGGVWLVDPNWRPPAAAAAPEWRAAGAAFVARGGRLVLFGYAARYVHDLGIEPVPPVCAVHRWGYDERALAGTARLGFAAGPGWDELFPAPSFAAATAPLAVLQAAPCTAPLVAFRRGAPARGTVVAWLAEERDGAAEPPGPPVLVHWRHGAGHVLACGLVPDLDSADPTARANAREFVRRCAAWSRAGGAELALWCEPDRAPAEPAPAAADAPPLAPRLAHWGWQVELAAADGAAGVRAPDDLLARALLPAWQAGADALLVDLVDRPEGLPVGWPDDDPIARPAGWRGAPLGATWGERGLGRLAAEAHARGVLLFGHLARLPGGERPTERLVALRHLARELAGARPAGVDGFVLGDWWPDDAGHGLRMVQDYQPAAALVRLGERVPALAGALRALDAADGAPRGLPWPGISAVWRDGFPADLFPVGVLDAGGTGSAPDWLVAQANDFVRARQYAGGTLWWRSQRAAELRGAAAYALGLGLEPLVAAVAMPLAATGQGGIRAAGLALLDPAPAGFGAEVDAPAVVHALQNNWLRLLGSGGALQFDPTGLARFRPGEATLLSPGFLTTRLIGARPDGGIALPATLGFAPSGGRGPGGYGPVAHLGAPGPAARPPQVLAAGAAPEWPATMTFDWSPAAGSHELTFSVRAVAGRSAVAVRLDGALLQCVPVTAPQPQRCAVPVHIARTGRRQLAFEVLAGGEVAVEEIAASRVGEVAAEATAALPAGSLAKLAEHSCSSFHAETVELTTVADLPALVVRVRTERAARNLQVERRIALPGHRALAVPAVAAAEPAGTAIVLTAVDGRLPDVVCVPLQLRRHDQLAADGGAVVWRSAPDAGYAAAVGLLFAPPGQGLAWLRGARQVLEAIDRPLVVDQAAGPELGLASDVPRPWSRVVQWRTAPTTPVLVQERGWWTWRGTQPDGAGGAFLRVCHTPGEPVRLLAGPAVLARTRPGPGSLRLVALRDVGPRAAVVRVLQPSRLQAPSIVLAADFDEVFVDGQPWAWFDGRQVFLPDRPGTYRVEARATGRPPAPHVQRTAAPLVVCRYLPEQRELMLTAAPDPSRPPELGWTAILGGPMPSGIDNGELVPLDALHLPAAARAAAGGLILVRFAAGTTRIRYGG